MIPHDFDDLQPGAEPGTLELPHTDLIVRVESANTSLRDWIAHRLATGPAELHASYLEDVTRAERELRESREALDELRERYEDLRDERDELDNALAALGVDTL